MSIDSSFIELLGDFAELIEKEYVDAAPDGLSVLQMRVLSDIHSRQTPPTMRELATAARITMPSASVIADKLETEGFLVRKPNPVDRRIIRAYLTEKGEKTINTQTERLRRILDKAMQDCSEKDIEVAGVFFRRFITAAKEDRRSSK